MFQYTAGRILHELLGTTLECTNRVQYRDIELNAGLSRAKLLPAGWQPDGAAVALSRVGHQPIDALLITANNLPREVKISQAYFHQRTI